MGFKMNTNRFEFWKEQIQTAIKEMTTKSEFVIPPRIKKIIDEIRKDEELSEREKVELRKLMAEEFSCACCLVIDLEWWKNDR